MAADSSATPPERYADAQNPPESGAVAYAAAVARYALARTAQAVGRLRYRVSGEGYAAPGEGYGKSAVA